MPVSKARRWLVIALSTCGLGCAKNPAPAGWLAPMLEAPRDPRGAWIAVSRLYQPEVSGEFLAVDHDSLYVLEPYGEVKAVPTINVVRAQIAFYEGEHASLATWTTIGSVATLSNGWFLIFTLPAWLIAGPVSTAAQSRAPIRNVSHSFSWEEARAYARFPAGLPDSLPRTLPPGQRR